MASRRLFMGGAAGLLIGSGLGVSPSRAKSAAGPPATPANCRLLRSGDAPVDAAIWAMWYHLDANDQVDFNAWLHQDYLPRLSKREGYLWTAHYRLFSPRSPSTGDSGWMVLVGADGVAPFLVDTPDELARTDAPDEDVMLGMRRNISWDVYLDIERVKMSGSAAARYAHPPGPQVRMEIFEVNRGEEIEFWETCYGEILPTSISVAGSSPVRIVRGLRTLTATAILHELDENSADELERELGQRPVRGTASRKLLRGEQIWIGGSAL